MYAVAAVLSYKMASLTDRTVEDLMRCGWELGKTLFVIENQHKDLAVDVSQYVTDYTGENLRMTGGWNWIADHVGPQCDRVWFCTNDFEITHGMPSPRVLEEFLREDIGWWHPAVEHIHNYAYPWMFGNNPAGLRDVLMTDSIAPAITSECMEKLRLVNGGKVFDPAFYRGWGIDYDTCYQIRQMGRRVVIHDAVRIKHVASKTYTTGAAPESMEQFYGGAHAEMAQRMREKYGEGWYERLMS